MVQICCTCLVRMPAGRQWPLHPLRNLPAGTSPCATWTSSGTIHIIFVPHASCQSDTLPITCGKNSNGGVFQKIKEKMKTKRKKKEENWKGEVEVENLQLKKAPLIQSSLSIGLTNVLVERRFIAGELWNIWSFRIYFSSVESDFKMVPSLKHRAESSLQV